MPVSKVAFTAALGLGAWAAAVPAADTELERQRGVWQSADTAHYVYAYQKYCDCHRDDPPQTFVEVRNGAVTDVYHLHADSERRVPARDGSLDLYWTIPDLFGLLATAEERGVSYRADYHPDLGYPTHVYIDYDMAAVGEEIDIRVTAFEPRD